MTEIRIFETSQELIKEGARLFLAAGAEAMQRGGVFSVALSGGSTPLPLYQLLAETPDADILDWSKVHFFWGDERPVGPDHPESNYRAAYQALLEPRGISADQIHRVQAELQPKAAAQLYQEEILNWAKVVPPRIDLILLGMGDDGHTASIFPGTSLTESASEENGPWVQAVYVGALKSWRISFTPRLINSASHILFLVKGRDKAKALNQVLNGPFRPARYPAQLIQPLNGQLIWLIDKKAAAELGNT